MRKCTSSFIAVDPLGDKHRINVWTEYSTTETYNEPPETIVVSSQLVSGGRLVNYIAKGHYEFVDQPGVPLRSDDPRAI